MILHGPPYPAAPPGVSLANQTVANITKPPHQLPAPNQLNIKVLRSCSWMVFVATVFWIGVIQLVYMGNQQLYHHHADTEVVLFHKHYLYNMSRTSSVIIFVFMKRDNITISFNGKYQEDKGSYYLTHSTTNTTIPAWVVFSLKSPEHVIIPTEFARFKPLYKTLCSIDKLELFGIDQYIMNLWLVINSIIK